MLYEVITNALVYLVNLPGAGLWMGATPEVLLQSKGKTLETVSLAGTQSRRDDSDYRWATKEIEEQAFVSRYMLDVFYKFNIHPYTTQGPETLESGNVAHLKTSFNFSAKRVEDRLGDFVAELHPTPAVCGLPKSKAQRFISTIERHERRYYSGYLGPWRMNDCIRLFVNLRCMEITVDRYMLYAGGGITGRRITSYNVCYTKLLRLQGYHGRFLSTARICWRKRKTKPNSFDYRRLCCELC